jgi:hypothetical protein
VTISLRASTGNEILVWRENEVFHACRKGSAESEQVCLPVDLFEVIADLAGLELDRSEHASEAVQLAAVAHRRIVLAQDDKERGVDRARGG